MTAVVDRTCQECGQDFEARREHAKYCSTRCRVAANRKAERQERARREDPERGCPGDRRYDEDSGRFAPPVLRPETFRRTGAPDWTGYGPTHPVCLLCGRPTTISGEHLSWRELAPHYDLAAEMLERYG